MNVDHPGPLSLDPETPAEESLLAAALSAEQGARLVAGDGGWGPDAEVRGRFLAALCLSPQIGARFDRHGIWLSGALVVGEMDLVGAVLEWPLRLERCFFTVGFDLRHARLQRLSLIRTVLNTGPEGGVALSASGVQVAGDLTCHRVRSRGGLDLSGAQIGGHLDLKGSHFELPEGDAILASRLRLGGDLNASGGFRCVGRLVLTDSRIGGRVGLTGAVIENPGHEALQADRMVTGAPVHLDEGFTSRGAVSLYGAKIGGDLFVAAARLENPQGDALFAAGIEVDGDVDLTEGVQVFGRTSFFGCRLRGGFRANWAALGNDSGVCLDLSESRISWNVLLDSEAVPNSQDSVGTGGTPTAPAAEDGPRHRLIARGAVRLRRIVVEGDLRIGGSFVASTWPAIDLTGAKIGGDVLVRSLASIDEGIDAAQAVVSGGLEVAGVLAAPTGGTAFVGRNARVDGVFRWCSQKVSPAALVDLSRMKVGTLEDCFESWPSRLRLDGFRYQELVEERDGMTIAQRLIWLSRQVETVAPPQPYEQLAEILRRRGRRSDATEVLIEKQRALARSTRGKRQRLANWLKDLTVRYGYQPQRAGWVLLTAWVAGAIVYWALYRLDALQPALSTDIGSIIAVQGVTTPHYPRFEPLVFSAEMTIPILDLFQKSYWEPDQASRWGGFAWGVVWSHRLIGWLFTIILGAAQLDLLRND